MFCYCVLGLWTRQPQRSSRDIENRIQRLRDSLDKRRLLRKLYLFIDDVIIILLYLQCKSMNKPRGEKLHYIVQILRKQEVKELKGHYT